MPLLVWVLAVAVAVAAMLASPTWSLAVTDSLRVAVSSEIQWPEGALAVRAGAAWGEHGPRPEVFVSYTPRTPVVTISWTCDSLACILVRPGDVIEEGQLIGFVSAAAQARAAALAERLPQVHDPLVAAEILAELERISRENEIHALVPGRVVRVEVEQIGSTLRVRLLVRCNSRAL